MTRTGKETMAKKKMKIFHERLIDRFSNLPEGIINQILSFTDTKYAVQTSVLSKRRKILWTHVPNLNFNSKFITRIESFKTFVLHVLNHHKASNLRSLSLVGKLAVDQSFIDRVMNYAVSHHVQQLHISSTSTPLFDLPTCLLTSQSLRILKLEHFIPIEDLPNSLVFASLTTLHLNNIVSFLYNENFWTDQIFSSCIHLKNLFLTECFMDTQDVVITSGPQLVNLTIPNLIVRRHGKEGKVMVSAPRLTSFNFTAKSYLGLSIDSSPNLDMVTINIYHDYIVEASNDQNWKREYIFNLINMFQHLSNAKSLTLSLDTIKVLSIVPGLLHNQPSPFNNLKSLKVTVTRRMKSFVIPLHVMTFLLSSFPDVDMVVELLKELMGEHMDFCYCCCSSSN